MTRVVLPCGCIALLEHQSGDRLVRCGGGGATPKNGSIARGALRRCPGGRQYKATAEPVAVVRYAVSCLKASA